MLKQEKLMTIPPVIHGYQPSWIYSSS